MIPTATLQTYIVGAPAGVVRINMGCSHYPRQGYLNIDWFEHDERVITMDPRRLELPDDYADEIMSYTLEHIPYTETLSVLHEWLRVLKPGGKIEITVPDMEWLFGHWLKLPESERWGCYLAAIFGLQRSERDFHYTGFTHARMKDLLTAAGYTDVVTEPHGEEHMRRILATARKPLARGPVTYAPSEPSIESALKPIVAFSRAEKIFASPLPDVDYTWLCQKLEYQKLFDDSQKNQERMWHYQRTLESYNTQLANCHGVIANQNKLLEDLQKALNEQGVAFRKAVEEFESKNGVKMLKSSVEGLTSQVQSLQAELAMEKDRASQLSRVSQQLAETKDRLSDYEKKWQKLLAVPGFKLFWKWAEACSRKR